MSAARLPLLALILTCLLPVTARGAEPLKLTLRPSVTVTAPTLTVGDLAILEGASEVQTRLAQVIVGASPLPGEARAISAGYLKMRLRREGFDLASIAITGDAVTVTRSAEARPSCPNSPRPALSSRRGEPVEVILTAGAIVLRVSAKIVEELPDEAVMVRIDSTQAVLRARRLSPHQCEVNL